MPNWCEGVLKVRGTKENINNFLRNGIDYCDYDYQFKWDEEKQQTAPVEIRIPRKPLIDIEKDSVSVYNAEDCWIKDTHRMFVNSEHIYGYYDDENEEKEDEIVCIDIKQAWGIQAANLRELSQKYNLDFRIFATECGMQFSQEIEVIKGEITKNEEIKYDDFEWEAPDPRLGG